MPKVENRETGEIIHCDYLGLYINSEGYGVVYMHKDNGKYETTIIYKSASDFETLKKQFHKDYKVTGVGK